MTSIAEQVGRVVGGRYRLLAPVGVGASSQVFAATDTRLARRVAVKVLHPMLASDGAFLRRFRAEARLAASLDHPHIMRVFDWGEEEAGPYLVLEYLGGGSLRGLLDTGARLSHSQVAVLGAQAASGLAYAHRRGIVHRDIKPGNLLFDDEGHLRVADFGVARALAESALTEPLGAIFGTVRYASPEQAEGRPLDDHTDVYSLALVLYETLTGRVPFTADTVSATLMARIGAILPSAPELGPLAPILAQAAISEPLARLDAGAMQSDLELLARELPPAALLPLARVHVASVAADWSDRDPTILDPAAVVPPDAAAPPLEDITLLGLDEAAAAEAPGKAEPGERAGAPSAVPASAAPADEAPGRAALIGPVSEVGPPAPMGPPAPDEAAGVLGAGAVPAAGVAGFGLAGAGVAAAIDAPGDDDHEVWPSATPSSASAGTLGPIALAGDRPMPLDDPTDPQLGGESGGAETRAGRPGRRRWVKWLVAAVVLAGAAAGGSIAALHYRNVQLYNHVVPRLESMTVAKAEAAARHAGLVAKVTATSWDAGVPAGDVISQSIRSGHHELAGTVIDLTVSKGPQPVPVPSLTGDDLAQAESALGHAHLAAAKPAYTYSTIVKAGTVIFWSDEGKSELPGTPIRIVVSLGHAPVAVPVVPSTDTYTEAAKLLGTFGFRTVQKEAYSSSVSKGYVVSVSPDSTSGRHPYGSVVTVTISKGPQYVKIPDVLYDSFKKARSILESYGFKVAAPVPSGVVVDTFPGAGTSEPLGYTVDVFTI